MIETNTPTNETPAEPKQPTLTVERRIDAFKQFYDFFKHITTINTGTIVILATFLNRTTLALDLKAPLVQCFALLVASLVFSLGAMGTIAFLLPYVGSRITKSIYALSTVFAVCLVLSILTFLLGIVSLVVIAATSF